MPNVWYLDLLQTCSVETTAHQLPRLPYPVCSSKTATVEQGWSCCHGKGQEMLQPPWFSGLMKLLSASHEQAYFSKLLGIRKIYGQLMQ